MARTGVFKAGANRVGGTRCSKCNSTMHNTAKHAKACTVCKSGSHSTEYHKRQLKR